MSHHTPKTAAGALVKCAEIMPFPSPRSQAKAEFTRLASDYLRGKPVDPHCIDVALRLLAPVCDNAIEQPVGMCPQSDSGGKRPEFRCSSDGKVADAEAGQ